jgi:hypothetical protein
VISSSVLSGIRIAQSLVFFMSVILRFDAVIGLNQQHVQGVEETDSKNNSYGRCVGGKQMLQVRLITDICVITLKRVYCCIVFL